MIDFKDQILNQIKKLELDLYSLEYEDIPNKEKFNQQLGHFKNQCSVLTQLSLQDQERESTYNNLLQNITSNEAYLSRLNNILRMLMEISWLNIGKKCAIFLFKEKKSSLNLIASQNINIDSKGPLQFYIPNFSKQLASKENLTPFRLHLKQELLAKSPHPEHKVMLEIFTPEHILMPMMNRDIIIGFFCVYGHSEEYLNDSQLGFLNNVKQVISTIIIDQQNREMIAGQQMNLVQSSKLASLGEMASGIAHEINNPLAIIGGLSMALVELSKKEILDAKKINEVAQVIQDTVKRAASIISGLRNFSRDSKDTPIAEYSLKNIIEKTLSFCSEKFKNQNLQLEVNLPPEDIIIKCKETQISQVLLNLIINAQDAIAKLEEKWIKLDVELSPDKKEVIIKIIDSGKGIPLEIQDKIMNPFFTTKEVGKGTGLGLSISYGIIDAHKGKLFIDHKAPNTCFIIKLPL